jgi:hypothetical protein
MAEGDVRSSGCDVIGCCRELGEDKTSSIDGDVKRCARQGEGDIAFGRMVRAADACRPFCPAWCGALIARPFDAKQRAIKNIAKRTHRVFGQKRRRAGGNDPIGEQLREILEGIDLVAIGDAEIDSVLAEMRLPIFAD